MMSVPLDQFVKHLEDSGIIAGDALKDFLPPKATPKDAEELAKELVRQKKLTRFQAELLWQGKGKSLVLGNYVLMEKIGQGGMGAVYKAEHRRMKRVVAIKMLPTTMMKNAGAAARFQREVEAAAKLRHPNIVAADDADEANGIHFLVMEYVEGADLSALVKKNGPFLVDQAVGYVLQAARGLEFAHRKGIVHRDIKPSNLLLDPEGTIKILDMGLARFQGDTSGQAELTGTGAVMGTVDYMAPEQALSTKTADARADIYSLGCSLFYLLTGKATYDGETLTARLMAHQNEPIPSLQSVRAEVPEQVEAVFRKMVAKKVVERYQTVTEMIADLASCRQERGQPLAAQQPAPSMPDANLSSLFAEISRLSPATVASAMAPATDAGRGGRRTRKRWLLAAGGTAAVLLAGIFVLTSAFRNDDRTKSQAEGKSTEVAQRKTKAKETSGRKERPDDATLQVDRRANAPDEDAAPSPAKAPFDAAHARKHQEEWAAYLNVPVEYENSMGMKFRLIPPGEFMMGSTDEDVAAALKAAEETKANGGTIWRTKTTERPQHPVVITRPFLMGATEVTVGQFRRFVEATKYVTEAEQYGFGDLPGKVMDDKVTDAQKQKNWRKPGYAVPEDSPVLQITWNDAAAYCQWLSSHEKKTCRLPTEAEWEYACRAGTTTQYSFGDDHNELPKYGWHTRNSGNKSHPVARLLANDFGLFDVHGNVVEWCGDWYDEKWYAKSPPNDPTGPITGTTRVVRGGDWLFTASNCRSAYRLHALPTLRTPLLGFRCVLVW